jgi:hypothetical protein
MKALNIDFAPRRRIPTRLWIALSLCLGVLAGQQVRQAWMLQQHARETELKIAAMSQQLDRLRQARQDADRQALKELPYGRDAAAVAKLASFPLDRVLRTLEATRVQGIKLSALDIAGDGLVKADLEFTDHEMLMRYLEELNAGEPTPRWRLVQAQSGIGGAGTAAVNTATISSQWGSGASE